MGQRAIVSNIRNNCSLTRITVVPRLDRGIQLTLDTGFRRYDSCYFDNSSNMVDIFKKRA